MRMVATPTGTLRVPRAQRPRGTVVPNALPKLPNMPWSEQKPKRDYRQNTPYDVYEVYAKVAEAERREKEQREKWLRGEEEPSMLDKISSIDIQKTIRDIDIQKQVRDIDIQQKLKQMPLQKITAKIKGFPIPDILRRDSPPQRTATQPSPASVSRQGDESTLKKRVLSTVKQAVKGVSRLMSKEELSEDDRLLEYYKNRKTK
eukprot:CAMPEP_0206137544 /NCGR_PEP_ID=MMETSP1473-20131121/2649_1 /ASSEMBLY_ACC=CAM_ASM_001109 /TAXON_ID=1461547 /ORGANISM="Stichococcus sp, Strain RCC1054" /LENGTH=202 /DNA_ID=CAMNT_0053530683 /DNA_START=189 /DNA_END=797 /DNA_ORIENTATION=-